MDIEMKLKILAAAAKYDVSCSSSGSNRTNSHDGIGNASTAGICHSFTSDGRCISLLKILLSNICIYDCSYCLNRRSNDIPRAFFTPEEIADISISFYKRNYIEGLFLSSAIVKNSNYTMELLLQTVKLLRNQYDFNGYIHLKGIPGSDEKLIEEAAGLVDRISFNIELPSEKSLKLLAPDKDSNSILTPMSFLDEQSTIKKAERQTSKNKGFFIPGGQSTQMIIGASQDTDYQIINLSEKLYENLHLKRVYYSAYVPVNIDKNLPVIFKPPLIRENRLYQADWLLRFYGFKAKELLNENTPNFDLNFDPKTNWALNNLDYFPIEINQASLKALLRIPGLGLRSAYRIIEARKVHRLEFEDLKKIGVVLKRAIYFLTCNGKYFSEIKLEEKSVRRKLNPGIDLNDFDNPKEEQLTIFQEKCLPTEEFLPGLTGEL